MAKSWLSIAGIWSYARPLDSCCTCQGYDYVEEVPKIVRRLNRLVPVRVPAF